MERGPGRGFDGVAAERIEYEAAEFLQEDGWRLLPTSARDWAVETAGPTINDPITGTARTYWYCNITPGDQGPPTGPPGTSRAGAARPAEYELFVFGRHGLAVSVGSTEQFVPSPAGSRWRQQRWSLPVDGAGIRHDHRRNEPPNLPGANPGERSSTAPIVLDDADGVLPSDVLGVFGNLPLATQHFLVDPYLRSGRRPQRAAVRGVTEVRSGRLHETLWCYLFNARAVSFAHLRRSVPSAEHGHDAPWTSHDADRLAHSPWDLAAWVAPVAPATSTAPTEGARTTELPR